MLTANRSLVPNNQTISAIGELVSEVETAVTVINNLESESENIGMVLDVIRNIADQTDLLALPRSRVLSQTRSTGVWSIMPTSHKKRRKAAVSQLNPASNWPR